MKKPYSLDYGIERDIDRMAAVEEILDTLDKKPTPSELEQMASYILYGKDENGQNSIQRKETTDTDRRYKSFKRESEKTTSLDAILDNPLSDQSILKDMSERYIYTKKRETISRTEDANIPGMKELWDSIDRLARRIDVAEGKIAPEPDDYPLITDSYQLYQLKHWLIDLRRQQYYLKDMFKPTLHFLNVIQPSPQYINWDSDSFYWTPIETWQAKMQHNYNPYISKNLNDYEHDDKNLKYIVRRHTFDWENPKHIKALIDNYSGIYEQLWDKPLTWGRTLIYDFDRYTDMAHLTPLRTYILTRRIDKAPYCVIQEELQQKFGIVYNENHLCTIIAKEIPKRIALAAKRHRLLQETKMADRKKCATCGKLLPRDTIFFGINRGRADGFSSTCKCCERKYRIEQGGQAPYDSRNKDSNLHKMQETKTPS